MNISDILIGTSGYYYKDWNNTFYPDHIKESQRLKYYSEHFDILELNYTYYRLPKKDYSLKFVERSEGKIDVSVKATDLFTHKRKYRAKDIQDFYEGISPFLKNGLFIGILFQFPYSFHPSDQSLVYLQNIRKDFNDITIFLEFRNTEWINKRHLHFLKDNNLLLCSSDYPKIKGLPDSSPHLTGNYGYIRFHGRNKDRWYNHKESYERYDYSYNSSELLEWKPKIIKIAKQASKTFIFFNNHYNAQAVKNALMLINYFNN